MLAVHSSPGRLFEERTIPATVKAVLPGGMCQNPSWSMSMSDPQAQRGFFCHGGSTRYQVLGFGWMQAWWAVADMQYFYPTLRNVSHPAQKSLDWADIGIQQTSHCCCCRFKRCLIKQPPFLPGSEKASDILVVCAVQCDGGWDGVHLTASCQS